MEKIIVPIDFSKQSIDALNVAADLALKSPGCTLNMVHFYEKPISGITLQIEVDTRKLASIRKDINSKMDDLIKSLPAIKFEKTILADKNVLDILDLGLVKNADLIVMGTHGASGWKEFIIGSNAQNITRNAKCPVMVIKEGYEKFKLNNVLFVSSFLEEDSLEFEKIRNVVKLYNPCYHLLKIIDEKIINPGFNAQVLMEEFAKKYSLDKYTVNTIMSKSIGEGVSEYSKSFNVDCVIIETHGRKGLNRIMQSSVAEELVGHLNKPVMTVKIS
jgi:nucleotide-binding universal stress UspA family protein